MSANAGPATATGLTVGDVIRAQLYRVPSTATIGAAAEEFVRRDVECLIVESDDGQISVRSQRALLQALLPTAQELYESGHLPDEAELEDIAREHSSRPVSSARLTNPPVTPATQPAMKALATMLADNERRVLVEDENGLAGIATQRDLTRTILLQLRVDTS
jgi:predicted transcriptional regulator